MPVTVTRGLGTVGCACPAWEQRTVAPTWSKKPGMANSYTITNAPALTVTVGPVITMLAPLPFWM